MRRWQQIVIIVILLALPLLIFASSKKAPSDYNFVDRTVLTAILPLQLLSESFFDFCADKWDSYVDLRYTHRENQLLRIKLHELQVKNFFSQELLKENQRLRELLNYSLEPGFTHVGASVIATGPAPFFHSVTINRGMKDGVTIGAAVIVPTGVIGRIVALNSHSSEVALITDPNSSIDVLLATSRSRGRVVGLDEDQNFRTTLNYILRSEQVELGEKVVTSGLDGLFPKGLPVGQVVEIRKHHYGLYQELILESAADFTHLEEVLVLIPNARPGDETP